ncbi:MAG: HDOD domain-containing protein [Rhodoferax sp.]|nr:HDOD domain-containing protein [Rhodoferax sp.]
MTATSAEFPKELLAAIDGMQAFPTSVQNILRLTGDADCAPRELVEVIQSDPIVTIKVLRVVNSAYYSLSRPVTSVDGAVVFLGFNTIKNMALSIAALSLLPNNPLAAFDTRGYLQHSLCTASIARVLGARFEGIDAHDFFIAGLLHDFGKVVLAQVMPKQFNQAVETCRSQPISLHPALLQSTGIHHAELGAMLLEHWRFAPVLVNAIRSQYASEEGISRVALCVHVANQLGKRLGTDFVAHAPAQPLAPWMEQALGGDLDAVLQSLGDMHQVMEEGSRFADL